MEEEKLAKEGEMFEELAKLEKVGYNEEDYEVVRDEYANCIHEYVAPKGFKRKEYKKPIDPPKKYKFTLDKF